MKLSVEKQIEIYDFLEARYGVSDEGIEKNGNTLSWEGILEISNIIKNE